MRTLLISAAILALAGAAHAQGTAASVSNSSGGSATATTGSATAQSGGNTQSNAGNNAEQRVETNIERAPVATAWSAPLTFSQGTCYVSAAAGGQGITFGLSAAIPFEDKGCTVRATAQALYALGEREAAVQYLAAKNKDVADALRLVRDRR